ncbi:MAG: cellulase family glycosylhydrolase, partial [Chlorobia bacterium]|nr:cellulase family glycosylhydrolase [Fimbriimonadaceae bacterium]
TDPEAKRRTKMWLRYAVARWGHSPSVMAWELFNEVEWVDSRYEEKWKDVVAWHKEMSDYIRSIDPYQHLVATSSTFEFPNLYDSVDFYQPHTYPPDVRTAISGFKVPEDKPLFFGEYGPGVLNKEGQRLDVRDGIWAGLLADHAGAGSFWTWDVVHKENLYGEYKVASKVLQESGLADHPGARPSVVKVSTTGTADMTFNPGTGWAKAEKTSFIVASGSKPEGLGGLPSFLQGPSKRDMFPAPLTFTFRSSKPGIFTLQLAQVSKAGAKLRFSLNGKQVAEKAYPATATDGQVSDKLTVPYPAGANEIQIENVEADWVVMRSFTFSGMDYEASVQSIGQVDWLMARITASAGASPASATLSSLGLSSGNYDLTITDLENGKATTRTVKVESISHQEKIDLPSKDVMVVFSVVK